MADKDQATREASEEVLEEIRKGVFAKLEKRKVTDDWFARKLIQGANAKKAVVGVKRMLPDFGIRLKYLEAIGKYRGDWPSDKHEMGQGGIIVHDLSERLEKAIEATINAITGKVSGSRKKT